MSVQIGATVRATNRTFGLAPARPYGPLETVTAVDSYYGTVTTAEGHRYGLGDYLLVSNPPAESVGNYS